ncbi:MAG TPA: SDR family oxidoreductase [Puia sp.]|jgi:short-subunit dehydrogenase|uniref:SDR family oxidoreductase n=1 Tax=Puia sp. TaxID=2045100 RepID=UPI002D064931|nr:SDR family oxidoreductase [Puia sp.]HVU95073.1 SDR family oxidoreductase [Puia sp.]
MTKLTTVLLLGAGSDIATALARKYASLGYGLQLAARNPDNLRRLASDLQIRYGARASLHPFDATRTDTHQAFWTSLDPKPDITCCIFGYLGDQKIAEENWEECEKILITNYVAAVSILNLAAAHYANGQYGCITGISSVAGERGRAGNYFYGSAKAGFTAYLSGLRNRLSHLRVHVLTVKPGFVYTRMTEGMRLPAPVTATPEEVANAIVKAVNKKKNVIYVRWVWRWIMLVIKCIPENIFKKLNL